MIIKKITTGFVIQTFDTDKLGEDGKPVCTHQEFVAGEADFENANGEPVNDDNLTDNLYWFFNMEQPGE